MRRRPVWLTHLLARDALVSVSVAAVEPQSAVVWLRGGHRR
jgi:hypothetical protein